MRKRKDDGGGNSVEIAKENSENAKEVKEGQRGKGKV
jgi:hypothetical protein